GQLESEVSAQAKILGMREAELLAAKEQNADCFCLISAVGTALKGQLEPLSSLTLHKSSLEREFSSYKARAHALLQKKDADLVAAKDSEQLKALEEALKEAENEVLSITEERDRALLDLQSAMANNEKELAESVCGALTASHLMNFRDTALENAKQQIRSLETKLDLLSAKHLREKEEWGLSLQNVEETWRIRCEAMKAENEAAAAEDMKKELEELKQRCKKLKEEHASFHDLADRMIEDKDNEISRLLDENKNLRQSLQSRPTASQNDTYNTALHKLDPTNLSPSDAEHQILILARQQAQREEELAQSQRHILALQEEIEELEHENRLHSQQEAMLKSELRNMERSKKREGVDMTYLKNIILKLLETGEVEVLLPVIGMLLQFSPEEMQKCQQTYQNSKDVPPSPASDTSGSGLSLFSRFSFSGVCLLTQESGQLGFLNFVFNCLCELVQEVDDVTLYLATSCCMIL
ncbi:protein GRIP-like, partial [Trifolium pratense]